MCIWVFCNRPKPAVTQQWIEDASYFDGTGYAEITPNPKCAKARFELDIKLVSHNGILLLLRNEVRHLRLGTGSTIINHAVKCCNLTWPFSLPQTKFACVAVLGGRVKLFYNFNGTFVEEEYKGTEPDLLFVSDTTAKLVSQLYVIPARVWFHIACVDITYIFVYSIKYSMQKKMLYIPYNSVQYLLLGLNVRLTVCLYKGFMGKSIL